MSMQWSAEIVELWIREAGETLMLSPRVIGPKAPSTGWPAFPRDQRDAYGYDASRFVPRPTADALQRMTTVWGWINALPDETDRILLYSFSWSRARRSRFHADFARKHGISSRTVRRRIIAICQGIADRLVLSGVAMQHPALDAMSREAPEPASQDVASTSYASHEMAADAKPSHQPESADHRATIRRLERRVRDRRGSRGG